MAEPQYAFKCRVSNPNISSAPDKLREYQVGLAQRANLRGDILPFHTQGLGDLADVPCRIKRQVDISPAATLPEKLSEDVLVPGLDLGVAGNVRQDAEDFLDSISDDP